MNFERDIGKLWRGSFQLAHPLQVYMCMLEMQPASPVRCRIPYRPVEMNFFRLAGIEILSIFS